MEMTVEKMLAVQVPADLEALSPEELADLVRRLTALNRQMVTAWNIASSSYAALATTVGEGVTSVLTSAVTGFEKLAATVAGLVSDLEGEDEPAEQ